MPFKILMRYWQQTFAKVLVNPAHVELFIKNSPPIVDELKTPLHELFDGDAVFVVNVGDLLNAAAIFFCSQRFSLEPGFDDFHCDSRADNLAADAKDVGIGMLAGQLSAERVLADSRIDAVDFVSDEY